MSQHRVSNVALLLAAALAFGAACRGGANQSTPTMLPTPEPQATATLDPSPTDDPGLIDPIIAALRSGDADAIRPHIGYGGSQVSCGATASQGSPAPDTCTSTPEQVFVLVNCQEEYLPPSQIQRALDIMAAMKLYSVYRIPPQFRTVGQFSAILEDQRPETAGQAWEAVIDDERIVALIYSCTVTPQEYVKLRHYTEAVLPPQTP